MTPSSDLHFVKKIYKDEGLFKPWAKTIFWQADQMLKNALIVRNLDNAKLLAAVSDRLEGKSQDDERFAIFQVMMTFYNNLIDDVAIISAFEIYAKAMLLSQRFLIHEVAKPENQKRHQKSEPIHFKAYLANDVQVSERTLSCSILLGPAYSGKFKLQKATIEVLAEMNESRNRIHFHTFRKATLNTRILSAISDLRDSIGKRLTRRPRATK